MTRQRGFVLLVALGVLGVLGLLAATFATLSRVERAVANSYVDKVRAKMLAQSGIERAIAGIRGRAMIQGWDDARNDWYYREMLNAPVGALIYSPPTIAKFGGYIPTRAYGAAPRTLEVAVDAGLTGTPAALSFPDGSNPNISGQFPGTYEADGDVYAIRALDCASMIYVNDQNPQIKRVLNNLGIILGISGGFSLGDRVVAAAKLRGKPFNNKAEILDEVFIANLGATDGRTRFNIAKQFITCHAWVDMTVMHYGGKPAAAMGEETGETKTASVEPVAPVADVASLSVSPMYATIGAMSGSYASLPTTSVLAAPVIPGVPFAPVDTGGGFAQFVSGQGTGTVAGKFGGGQYWIEPRAPINMNTVTREVLVAMLWGLSASFLDYVHNTSSLTLRPISISQTQAEAAADHMISGRYTFGSPAGAWAFNDWMHFKNEVIDTIPGLDRFQKALIHVNCNPNTDIKKLNPDMLLVDSNPITNPVDFVRLDKSDITQKSMELGFSSNGFYEIECLGRVYNAGKIMAEEKIETVVKVFDVLRYSSQEQFEKDRNWINDDSAKSEGDLLAGGYPPVVSMPEYPYNPSTNPNPYRATTGDITWAADYDGYMILNGPAKVNAGLSPGPFYNGGSKSCRVPHGVTGGWSSTFSAKYTDVNYKVSNKDCRISFVAGFHQATFRPAQSHANQPGVPAGFTHLAPNPTNPEYSYSCPNCKGVMTQGEPAISLTTDAMYTSAYYSPKQPYQFRPTGAFMTSEPSSGWGGVTNFWEGGADLQPFGVYINYLKRQRFMTYWADEIPAGDFTVEFMYKPEVDHWEWGKTLTQVPGMPYSNGPCSRMHLWGIGAGDYAGQNYEIWCYVQGSRVYLDFYLKYSCNWESPAWTPGLDRVKTAQNMHYILYVDHLWKSHTWHHIEFSVVNRKDNFVLAGGTTIPFLPHNAMLFVDGVPAAGFLGTGPTSGYTNDPGPADVNDFVAGKGWGGPVYPGVKALRLPDPWVAPIPNNDIGTGPRIEFLSKLQYTPGFGMSQPSTIGTGDNLVMHHWRSHDAPFTPRNRYHSMSYYDGSTFKSGTGYKLEKAGVYKKRLTHLESVCNTKDTTVGTLSCTHYHPFHVHLYGHDGSAPTTSFGHITPALRVKSGGSYIDSYYYDGCAGLPLKQKITAGSEIYYMGWFEVATLVPVTMSPMLGDITLTYFNEPKTYYRLSSSEAK